MYTYTWYWYIFPCHLLTSPFVSLSVLVVTQIRGHTAGSSPLPMRFVPCVFIATRRQPLPPSLTRVELRTTQARRSQISDNGKAMLPKKKTNFKDTRKKISVPLAMSTNRRKKVSNLPKTPKNVIPGQILGQDRPENNSAKC